MNPGQPSFSRLLCLWLWPTPYISSTLINNFYYILKTGRNMLEYTEAGLRLKPHACFWFTTSEKAITNPTKFSSLPSNFTDVKDHSLSASSGYCIWCSQWCRGSLSWSETHPNTQFPSHTTMIGKNWGQNFTPSNSWPFSYTPHVQSNHAQLNLQILEWEPILFNWPHSEMCVKC